VTVERRESIRSSAGRRTLPIVAAEPDAARQIFELHPRNRERRGRRIGLLAQSGGTLVGAVVGGAVRTWLVDPNGQLQLLLLPADFRARIDPLELLNERGEVVAKGGELVTVGGAHLVKSDDSRRLGHEHAFSAWQISRAGPRNR
jgi:hypothetical protein